MERLPANFTNELYGNVMLKDFESAIAEPEIEDMYKSDYMYVSKMQIRTIKRYIPGSKCATDGVLEFSYRDKCFYGIQETKFKKPMTDWQLKQQLIQALMYAWMFEQAGSNYKFDVYILNSETDFVYVYNDELEHIKELLWYIFPKIKETPSNAAQNILIKTAVRKLSIPFKRDKITPTYPFHNAIRSIYKRCIK